MRGWTDPSEDHAGVAALFLRALGLVYLCAFLSLLAQVDGLVGALGIAPASELLDFVRERVPGPIRFFYLPTLFWLHVSDAALAWAAIAGAALGGMLLAGYGSSLALFAAYVLYLSFCCVGQVFLGYQWDALLCEAGFLAMWLVPPGAVPRPLGAAPPRLAVWLFRWLLFRFMFASGLVKLTSGDPAWRNLTALAFHYETQPLPTVFGWYAHRLPAALHSGSAALMFLVELVVPWLVLLPWPRARLAAFGPLVGLQLLIGITGNYGFFNLLTLALCAFALDDRHLPWKAGARPGRRNLALWPVAALLFVASLAALASAARVRVSTPVDVTLGPFQLVNPYGLFAVMTTERPQIVFETSRDATTWREAPYRYQAVAVDEAPAWVQPHMPRLDWQAWFAALSNCGEEPWVVRTMNRLLDHSPPVVRLFRDVDPQARRVRVRVWRYRFGRTAWWDRASPELYCGPAS